MADFVFSGGCRWNDTCAVDVKVGADGTPISCKNPITGTEISGGEVETATITISYGAGVMGVEFLAPVIKEGIGITAVAALRSSDTELIIPLYNGSATIILDDPSKLSVTGDLEIVADDYMLIVTGDGTIAISA